MSSPFTASSPVGTPTWTAVPNTDGNFVPLTPTTQQEIVGGGYGLGGYGMGPYGEGESTTVTVNLITVTAWTTYTTK